MKENVAQVRRLLVRIEESGSIPKRLMLWRKVISAAHDQHESELTKLDSLTSVQADPQFAAYGDIVV